MIYHDKGGRGVSLKVILPDEGGGGVQTPPKKDDIIYEQPLISIIRYISSSLSLLVMIESLAFSRYA